jgi:hypothetical protein
MISELLGRGVARIVASEISLERARQVREGHAAAPLEVRLVEPGDQRIFDEPCDGEPHPIWPDRSRRIIDGLIADRWHERR